MPRGKNITQISNAVLVELDAHHIGASVTPGATRRAFAKKLDGIDPGFEFSDRLEIDGDDIEKLLKRLRRLRHLEKRERPR